MQELKKDLQSYKKLKLIFSKLFSVVPPGTHNLYGRCILCLSFYARLLWLPVLHLSMDLKMMMVMVTVVEVPVDLCMDGAAMPPASAAPIASGTGLFMLRIFYDF